MGGQTVSTTGWTVSTNSAPILGQSDLDAVNACLGGVVSLPEQLFGHSWVDFHHTASGVSINFNALDALRGWQEEALPPVRVASSDDWMKTRKKEVEASHAAFLDYDWTFSTPYRGSTCAAEPSSSAELRAFTLQPPTSSGGTRACVWSSTDATIDRQMLMARDPLLLYDEVVLFESELDDNGVSNYSIKVRVMPRCWFALARFWLRVDGTMVRLREVRLFCRLDDPDTVLREVTHREGTMQELAAAGAPSSGSAYTNADSASVALQAVAPVGVKLFHTEKLSLSSGQPAEE